MNQKPPSPTFGGVTPPSSDFQATRDGRRGVPLRLDVDLSVARSIAGGNALVIGIAGNSFYSDPIIDLTTGLPIGGNVVAQFEDVTLTGSSVGRFTVAPQFIARIPFTRILIEHPAQPGKFARLIYGTDIDFTPGINAQVSITGTVSVAQARNWDFAAVDAGASFTGCALVAGNAANPSVAQIKNPGASTKTVYVVGVHFKVYSGTIADVFVRGWDADLGTDVGAVISKLNPFASTAGQSHVRSQNNAATPAGVNVDTLIPITMGAVYTHHHKKFDRPYRLDPGRGLIVDPNGLVNSAVFVAWDVVEV